MSFSLKRLEQTHDVETHWRSFELRPKGTVLPPGYKEQILARRPQFEAMVRKNYGIEINSGPFGIDSRPALIGAKYAEEQGSGQAYHDAVFSAYWRQARDISDIVVLRETAASVELDPDAFEAALDDSTYESAVTRGVMMAHQLGVTGVPALILERKYLAVGAQPYETLRDVVEQVKSAEVG